MSTMSPSHPPADGGQSSGSSDPAKAWRVTETGGPFTLASGATSGLSEGPMAGTFFVSVGGSLQAGGQTASSCCSLELQKAQRPPRRLEGPPRHLSR
jgi:hypothetical protein